MVLISSLFHKFKILVDFSFWVGWLIFFLKNVYFIYVLHDSPLQKEIIAEIRNCLPWFHMYVGCPNIKHIKI